MTDEFESLRDDPDLQTERGPGGTLVFVDGGQYCVIGPDFVSMEETDGYGVGATRQEAFANYAVKRKPGCDR